MDSDNFSTFIDVLLKDGWEDAGGHCYRKGDWLIVFDTSSWMELGTKRNPRLIDVPVPDCSDKGRSDWTLRLIKHLLEADDRIVTQSN